VVNPDYQQGMLTSLVTGVRALEETAAPGLVLALVDGPDISGDVVRRLVQRFRESRPAIVEPTHDGRHGHPLLIRRDIWPELLVADPGEGAKAVIRRHRSDEGQVPCDASVLVDLDTPAELDAWMARR
jgi:molybdenum cofactor cytidylyltransferase